MYRKFFFPFLFLVLAYSHLYSDLFSNLSLEEKKEDWAKEYQIGKAFLKERDYDSANQALKRGWVLLPVENLERRNEVYYYLVLSTYLSQDYAKVVQLFEKSTLQQVKTDFPGYHDLLLLLSSSYDQIGKEKESDIVLSRIAQDFPKEAEVARLKKALNQGSIEHLQLIAGQSSDLGYLQALTQQVQAHLKSPKLAKWLSILCPGAGYFYVGQKRSALTSFLFNSLLIVASWQLFTARMVTLGIFTLMFEAGWYVGGAMGSSKAATSYNNHLMGELRSKVVSQEKLFDEDLFYEKL